MYAVGGQLNTRSVLRYDGTTWKSEDLGGETGQWFRGVWGPNPDDVWVVGSSVVRKKAGAWSSVELPEGTGELLGVWGSSSRDLWFVGGASLLRYRE